MSTSRSNNGRPHATRTDRRRAAVDRRRQSSRRGAAAQVAARHRRARIRWAIAAVVLVVLVAGAIVLIARGGDDGPDVGLTGTRLDADGPLGITAPPAAYTIDYDLTNYTADAADPIRGTQQVRVSRPFSSQVTFTDGGATSTVHTNVLGLHGVTDGGTTTVTVTPAATALYDWRLDATLEDLVANGAYQLRERREVVGRECQVYRTGSPVETNQVTAATDDDRTDVCIDASGLILEEVTYLAGRPYQHLVATAVSEDPVTDLAVGGEPADPTTTFAELDPATPPVDGYWSLSSAPDGYERVGRYAYTVPGQAPVPEPASDDSTTTSSATEPPPTVTYFDVYRDGADTVIVQQGPTSAQPPAPGVTGEATIEPLGAVATGINVDGTMIVGSPPSPADWFVAISGSVDLATLSEIAATVAPG